VKVSEEGGITKYLKINVEGDDGDEIKRWL